MSVLIANEHEAIANILTFERHLHRNRELRDRLPYARAWYAHPDEQGEWYFGPSKFIGYRGMTPAEYLNNDPRDGRRTERQLQPWFMVVPLQDALADELRQKLIAFLANYGKAPSALARINVSREWYEARKGRGSPQLHRAVGDLVLLVVQLLPQRERARVLKSMGG